MCKLERKKKEEVFRLLVPEVVVTAGIDVDAFLGILWWF